MTVQILTFGIARDITGASLLTIEIAENATVGQLKAQLSDAFPRLRALTSWQIAVDAEFADDSLPLLGTNEIAIIPPVSGG